MKVCCRCKQNQDKSEFHKDAQKKDGFYSSCKSCMTTVHSSKEYREIRKHPRYTKIKIKHRCKKFGITVEQYETLIKNQGDCCAICNTYSSKFSRVLSIDHDHTTNKVRGLLCSNCNLGLGYFKDNPELLEKAIEYVIKSS